jgi:hypothetical protein
MSFETEAELSLTVDEGDLRTVRQQIEDGIGATEVGVTDGGSMSAQSAASSGGGRGARRSMRLAETRTDLLDDAVLYLESIDDAVTEGGLIGGGGGGGGIFAELVGAGAETAGDVGIEAGDTVAEAVSDVLTGTAASALGNTISSAINGSTVDVEPNPLPVEGGGSGGDSVTIAPDVGVSPTFKPTFSPDVGTDINLPDLNLGVPDTLSVDRTPLPVEREPLPVADTTIPVEDVGPVTVRFKTGARASSGGGRGAFQRGGDVLDDVGADLAEFFLPGDAPPSVSESLEKGGTRAGRPLETFGKFADTINPFTRGGFGSGSSSSTTIESNVDVEPRITVDVDTDRLVKEVGREFDEAMSDVRSELIDRIEELEDDLDDLERGLTRGGR